ncbi:MAG: ATP-dependent helicase RecQ [Thermoplasmata archaeon]|nr:ATP-dependent helicase RecQ [Thermoplasmata archaeon]
MQAKARPSPSKAAPRFLPFMPPDGIPKPDLAQATANLETALAAFKDALRASGVRAGGGPVFEALRRWRSEQARAKQLPPYVIATDAVLRAIEEARPASLDELRAVRGVGATKAETYGADILAVVAKEAAVA